jgi:predicted AlkP superfamily pyrophosphatase or phosphodiesterase
MSEWRRRMAIILAAGWASWCALPTAASGAEPTKKLLVIGIDGCRFDALQKAEAPRLDGLIERGSLAEPIRILPAGYREADTVSGPGWSNILCGVWPTKHGVLDNAFKSPRYDEFPHFFTRLKESHPEARTSSFSNWTPLGENIVRDADFAAEAAAEGKPYEQGDQENAAAASKQLREEDYTATVVYFAQVDEMGHTDGFHPSVPTYIAAIERVDAYVGKLLDAIEARPQRADEAWLVLVTTDHGGAGLNHGGGHDNPEVACSWLIASGDGAQRGRIEEDHGQVDLVPTGLAHLGVEVRPEWGLDGTAVGLK